MITRIVRMVFQTNKVSEFEMIFRDSCKKIRAFDGCEYLSLHKDHHNDNVFYTISTWTGQDKLDQYRKSELFLATWAKTKALFDEKPSAYSLEKRIEVE